LVLLNLGAADAVIGLEKEFDMERGVVLARARCLGLKPCEVARLAGYAFGGYPGHGCQNGGDFFRGTPRQIVIGENLGVPQAMLESPAYAVDLLEVVAGTSCAAGLRVTTLRHLALLICGTPANRRSR
jgi:hypothetical protein